MSDLSEWLKGGSDDGDEMFEWQKKQEEIARKKEEDRVARLNQQLARIEHAFSGGAALPLTEAFDWSKFKLDKKTNKATGLPEGYSYVQLPGTTKTVVIKDTSYTGGHNTGRSGEGGGGGSEQSSGDHWRGGSGGGNNKNKGGGGGGGGGSANKTKTVTEPGAWVIKGPDGKTYKVGDDMVITTGTDPASAGFNDEWYDKYRNAMTNYYMPDVKRQYGDANKELTYRLASAGTLNSSIATANQADLARQNLENKAMIADKADTAVGDMKQVISDEKAKLVSAANAAEDPTNAANTALATVSNLQLKQPDLTPLGEIFKIAAIGGANAISGYQSGSAGASATQLGNTYNKNGAVKYYG